VAASAANPSAAVAKSPASMAVRAWLYRMCHDGCCPGAGDDGGLG